MGIVYCCASSPEGNCHSCYQVTSQECLNSNGNFFRGNDPSWPYEPIFHRNGRKFIFVIDMEISMLFSIFGWNWRLFWLSYKFGHVQKMIHECIQFYMMLDGYYVHPKISRLPTFFRVHHLFDHLSCARKGLERRMGTLLKLLWGPRCVVQWWS